MKIILILFMGLLSLNSIAGNGTGKITGIIPYAQGTTKIFFVKTETITDTPECNSTKRFTITNNKANYECNLMGSGLELPHGY